MAVGYARNGHWVAGWIFSQPDIETAKNKALIQCKETSFAYAGGHACKVIYVDNDFQTESGYASRLTPLPKNAIPGDPIQMIDNIGSP